MKLILKLLFALLILAGFASCTSDEGTNENQINEPQFYSFQRNGESTISFSGQTTRILMATELINAMRDFEKNSDQLIAMFANQAPSGDDVSPFTNPDLNVSSKSVKSKVAASKDFFSSNTAESARIKADFEGWITAQVDEVYVNEKVLAEPGVAGQIADESSVRYVNAKGQEYNQMVNKGLIGALMVDQMLNNYLGQTVLDEADNRTNNDGEITAEGKPYTTMEHKWDEAYGYLFGASSDESDPLVTLGEDAFLNKYLSRVDRDEDFTGIAQDIFDAFKLGRAAIVAGDYVVRDQQANVIRGLISEVIAIRAIYYLQQGKLALPAAGNDFGTAFHDLSEGFGFVYSLRFLRQPNTDLPYFTEVEVNSFIERLSTGNGFWDLTGEVLDSISDEIAAKFDFTVAQAGS